MRKANKHRKRHEPPGPCGIWFQRQRQLSDNGGSTSSASLSFQHQRHHNHQHSSQALSQPSSSPQQKSSSSAEDMSSTWTFMQQSIDIVTPYLNLATSDTPYKRYQQLRPYMPSNFVLLHQICSSSSGGNGGEYTSLQIQDPLRLVVEVHSVEATHIHHNILTVQLIDETKTIIRAWLDPNWVQEQNQLRHRDSNKNIIRQGVVWMLKDVGMIIVPKDDQSNSEDQVDEDKIERILLISGKQIEKVWTPDEAKEYYENSDNGHIRYLEFMERRKAIQQPIHNNGNNERQQGGEEDDDEGEQGPDEEEEALMYRYRQQQQQQQQQNALMERTTVSAAAASAPVQDDEEAELDRFSKDAIGMPGFPPLLSQQRQPLRNGQQQQQQHNLEPTAMKNCQSQQSQAVNGVSQNHVSSTMTASNNEDGRGLNTQPSSQSPPPQPQQASKQSSQPSKNFDNYSESNHLRSRQQQQQQQQQSSFEQFAATRNNTTDRSSSSATTVKLKINATNTSTTQQSQFTQDYTQSKTQEYDDFIGEDINDENNNNDNRSSPTIDTDRKKKRKKKKKKRSVSGSNSTPSQCFTDDNDDQRGNRRMRTPKKRKKEDEDDGTSPGTPITPTRNKNTPISAIWTTTSQEVEDKSLFDLLDVSSEEEDNSNDHNIVEDDDNLAANGEDEEDIPMLDSTQTPFTSIFEPSNLKGVDSSVFSEEE